MLRSLSIAFVACLRVFCADLTAIADNTSYNAGSQVRARLHPAATATALVRYSGEKAPVAIGIDLHGADYLPLWTIPWDARTGRYEVDLRTSEGVTITDAASFAVHRQFAKVTTVEFDKSFYTTGDSVNTRIVVRNLSNRRLDHLQLEFEPYTYPWITAAPDEPALQRLSSRVPFRSRPAKRRSSAQRRPLSPKPLRSRFSIIFPWCCATRCIPRTSTISQRRRPPSRHRRARHYRNNIRSCTFIRACAMCPNPNRIGISIRPNLCPI